jgi:hypothetical protein
VAAGALEVVGKPAKKHAGINVAYRLISSLRFNPKAAKRRLRLGAGSTVVKKRVLSMIHLRLGSLSGLSKGGMRCGSGWCRRGGFGPASPGTSVSAERLGGPGQLRH